MQDTKYLLAYTVPVSGFISIYLGGNWSYFTVLFLFGLIPILEQIFPQSEANFDKDTERVRIKQHYFDILLYLNLPILYFLIGYYLITIKSVPLETYELVGMTLSTGMVAGSAGINVAHELGHRSNRWEQLLSKLLLLPTLYMHFFIEHNRGHHKHVATDMDPASAKKGDWLYGFWIKSIVGGYLNAWRLENKRLQSAGMQWWHFSNAMIQFHIAQGIYLLILVWVFGPASAGMAAIVGLIAVLLLETVNYIEHYGLRRQQLASGRYEPVGVQHSWNSNHEMGRILLYELTRHSDHHYKANRKYQILKHYEESPQMPFGYPAGMLLAMVPPLWHWVMDERIKVDKENLEVSR